MTHAPTVLAPTVATLLPGSVPTLSAIARPRLQRACACGGAQSGHEECESCRAKAAPLRRLASGGPAPLVAPPIVHEVLRSPGRPLDLATRLSMGERFGHDFGQVRVHDDARAAASAHAVGALAYTVGRDVVFGTGRFSPHTPDGRSLLTHELAHTVQQAATPYGGGEIPVGAMRDGAEREADDATHAAEATGAAVIPRTSGPRLQGRWDWKRFGIGALIGGLAGFAIGGFLGLGLGAVGLGVLRGLTGRDEPRRKEEDAPPPPGCDTTKGSAIIGGMRRALVMLRTCVDALTSLDPKSPRIEGAALARTTLERTFGSGSDRVANHVRTRLVQVRDMISTLLQRHQPTQRPQQGQPIAAPSIECHTVEADQDCAGANAYVAAVRPGQDRRESMVFCPSFFASAASNDDDRAGIVIHEVTHALLGPSIGDVAYLDQRFFPDLTTAEALTNADSYRLFALRMTTRFPPSAGYQKSDLVQDCTRPQEQHIRLVLHPVQRWVEFARRLTADRRPEFLANEYWVERRKEYLGDDSVAGLQAAQAVFDAVGGTLNFLVMARCHSEPDDTCPAGTFTTTASGPLGPEVQLCPDWLNERNLERQAILVLAEMIGHAGVADPAMRLKHAEFARRLVEDLGQAPPLEEILQSFEPPRRPMGDYPVRMTPPGVEAV